MFKIILFLLFFLVFELDFSHGQSKFDPKKECIACHFAVVLLVKGKMTSEIKEICAQIPGCVGTPEISICDVILQEKIEGVFSEIVNKNDRMWMLFRRIQKNCVNSTVLVSENFETKDLAGKCVICELLWELTLFYQQSLLGGDVEVAVKNSIDKLCKPGEQVLSEEICDNLDTVMDAIFAGLRDSAADFYNVIGPEFFDCWPVVQMEQACCITTTSC